MSEEEKIMQSVEEVEVPHEDNEGNEPATMPLSETGGFINPDGSVSSPAEAELGRWDSK